MKELVLDISHWDGDIDLAAWKRQRGLWGVIIKAGGNETNLGRYKDGQFENNYKKAVAAGLHVGAYYYTVTTDTENSRKDANHFADLLDGYKFDLPCYTDVEDPRQFQLSARALTDVIKVFCDTLRNRGYYAGLYTGGNAWLNNMYADELRDYANWIAWWRASWPIEAGDIGMWQQGGIRLSDGHIVFDDVSGYHDCDWCCIDYPARIAAGQTIQTDEPIEEKKEEEESKQMSGTAKSVIDVAYGELGYYAPDDPNPGSKYGRWLADKWDEDWLAGPSVEIWWCCMFVSWCLEQAGVVVKGFPSYNTDLALNNGARNYAVDKYNVQYGDIVIFNWDWDGATDHIGFATGSFDGSGFPTIEGNVSNAVQEKYRNMGNVAYVIRPHYSNSDSGNFTPDVSTDPKNNRDGGKLEIDGIGGWNTIIDLQHTLGTYEDGVISGQWLGNKDYHWGMYNVEYDSGTGSQLVEAIQSKVGAEVDGQWGPGTSRALQQWLVNKGYDIDVDGYFGRESVKALQCSLNDNKW